MGGWLERNRAYVLAALCTAVAAGLFLVWFNRPRPHPVVISTPVSTPTLLPLPSPTPAPLRVYVTGAVRQPDVYVLPPGSIVKDAVQAAGGPDSDADLDRVNMALQLADQQHVHVPRQGEEATSLSLTSAVQPAGDASAPVNINTASLEELDTLPGVGPAIAQRIVEYRTANGPFETVEEIMLVQGIGPATFARLQERIVVN
jgi:competence protein ComEA